MLKNNVRHVNEESRVLIVSMRNLKLHVSRAAVYEFEDVICGCDTVDLIVPSLDPNIFKVTNKLANNTAKFFKNGKYIKSLVNQKIQIEKEYDLFFFFCQSIQDILVLNSIQGWREKCRYAVCWLDEIWAKDIDNWLVQLRLLKNFDNIFMNFNSSIDQVADIVQRPCHSLSYGVDAIKFYPDSINLKRSVDVLNIGRRSAVTHNSLLELVEQKNLFYIYDTIKELYMVDYRYHRSLYSNFIKRSRYMIVNKAKFDLTGQTNLQEEVGPRFFEGAAGGAIMLGVPPKCEAFTQNFDWTNAVIEIPFNCSNIADIIADLDGKSEDIERISTDNIVNSLLRHDWVYRWENILATVGLNLTPEVQERKANLKNLVEMVNTSKSHSYKQQAAFAN
ncbi:glycosyltransferase [Calothrix sp. PCC 7507]|uniref:glycosyltransferase n=1 Tax=Calothrix sp. PCC 7507 TaxID=99598 RepID=UPI00029F2526|nr:glycosyltransferase [Calothrix sp. PCC 7507]AFY34571.1 hypothetical protein Cal7507_4192 [Calothrix sp. PCC 7507]